MDKNAQKTIVDGMLAFKPSIVFTTSSNPTETVKAAINSNPKIAYYLHGYSISGMMNRYEVRSQYIHKDTKLSEICTVNSGEECLRYMCQYVGNYKKKLIVVVKNSVDLSKVSNEFHEKHAPFYSNLVSISTSGYHSYGEYAVFEFGFAYRIGQVKLNMMEREVDAEVARIAKLLFSPGMPVEAKIYLAHNYLAANVVYKDKNANSLDSSYTQSAYGALIKHECVCQGYAEAFKRIMDYAGIQCDIVCGQIVGSTEYHAWNIVSLGKEDDFYHIDVTWDSAGRRPGYMYFCKNDSHFVGKRIWNRELNQACQGRYAVLSIARRYIYQNKNALLSKGIDRKVLDC